MLHTGPIVHQWGRVAKASRSGPETNPFLGLERPLWLIPAFLWASPWSSASCPLVIPRVVSSGETHRAAPYPQK